MKKYLAVYMGSESDAAMKEWNTLDQKTKDEREKAGMTNWMNWGMSNAGSITDHGSPIGKTKLINKNGIQDIKNRICAYTIIQAENHQAAAELFINHPHFTDFPGDSVEVMECLPMPEMK